VRWVQASVASLLVFASRAALAHGDIEGVSDFYAGLLHPVLVPAHLLVLIACGLLVSQHERVPGQRLLGGMLIGLLAGLLVSSHAPLTEGITMAGCLILGIAISLLVVSARELTHGGLLAIGLFAGIWIGIDSGHTSLGDQSPFDVARLGTWVGCIGVVCAIAGLLIDLRRDWQQVGIRVVGAWISAACILTLALSARTGLPGVPWA
jgi:hydrogenase/urease accessory protein HupE